jgi:carboxylesterase
MKKDKFKDIHIQTSNQRVVLFIHGIFASHIQFEELMERFLKKDYSVYGIALKGHNNNLKDLTEATHEDWLKQVNTVLYKLLIEYKEVFIVAHSMGSLLTLLSDNLNSVKKVVLLAPAIKDKVSIKSLKLGLTMNNPNVKDPYIVETRKVKSVNFDSPTKMFYGIKPLLELRKLIQKTKKHIHTVTTNLLIVISKKDENVRLIAGKYVYEHVSSLDKELIILEKSYHTYLDPEEEVMLYDKIVDYLQ